ncbi:MAG: hypothetical protein HZB56_18105 [Deltaproteobacteria bacterium]|nr:hypothetical protein [Deltaproteobacteria bacterium]
MKPLALTLAALALATPATRALADADRAGPYSFELTDESGYRLPTYQHQGRTYVLGRMGERYLLRVRNDSAQRIEVVASVDGRDVLDGLPASPGKRGYLVEAHGAVTIDGFRLSQESVAAFRFSSVSRSYAARMGDARDVGVVGVAVFQEKQRLPRFPVYEKHTFPPAPAPQARRGEAEVLSGDAAPSASAPEARSSRAPERPGLGTEFGEEHDSRVEQVEFVRAGGRPAAVLTVRYDDRRGLAALGIDLDGRVAGRDRWLRQTAEPFRGWARPPPGWGR